MKHNLYNWIDIYPDGKIQSHNKFLKPRKTSNGYYKIVIQNKQLNILKECSIHRLVAECFIPNPFNKEEVHHIDGNKSNNHYLNLQWVTKKEHDSIHNNERSILTSKRMINNKNHLCKYKISNQTVNEIKELFPLKTNAEISRIFNISRAYIGLIRKGKFRI